jgi:hypothetical protein
MPYQEITGGDGETGQTGEVIQDILNETHLELYDGIITREFNRAFAEDLLFDKNEIGYLLKTMDADISFSLITSGHITSSFSGARMRITADGSHSITFSSEFSFLYGIVRGQVLEPGTYEFYLLYDPSTGTVTVNVPGVSQEGSTSQQLSTPSSFTAVADGQTEIDLTWSDVANEVNYLIEWSADGSTGWTLLTNPAADAVSYSDTGLTANTTRYYRIKAIGNGTTYLDSAYASASATTEDAGDVTAPIPSFSPAAAATDIPVNQPIVVTFDEEIFQIGGSVITNNLAGIVVLKETDGSGANIAHSWTIDATKKILTITPTTSYGGTQLVYVSVNNFQDINTNAVTVAIPSTFTTGEYSILSGNNAVINDQDLEALFIANDTNFWLEITLKNWNGVGTAMPVSKFSNVSGQVTFYVLLAGLDVYLGYFGSAMHRRIKWTGAITTARYDGSVDTNNGLDRGVLLINGVTKTTKALDININSLQGALKATSAHLAAGAAVPTSGTPEGYFVTGWMKDFIIRSAAGTVVELDIPILREGIDVSGNGLHGSWV